LARDLSRERAPAIGGSITSSALLARIGRTTMHIGIVTMAIGLVLVDLVMRSAGGGVDGWELAGPLAITGYGMEMVFVPMFDVILAGVAPRELVLFDSLGHGDGAAAFVGAADQPGDPLARFRGG
jgi:hypothetical protein